MCVFGEREKEVLLALGGRGRGVAGMRICVRGEEADKMMGRTPTEEEQIGRAHV